ncbi:CLOCK-like protein [Mya arenaria]|uniref:CLOCK-like protein n=2 Tax=Mya arenaria TaxID=6604 RepID=A0ABY7DSQ8_MYAAR|nr:CLOCK-like protein [Mya arenaria]
MLVNELSTMVSTTNKKMDKSTVLKSTISFLKEHQESTNQAQVNEIKENWKPSFLTNDEFMHLMLEALDSFMLVFTQQGIIMYTSDSVASLLGHLPTDLMNQSIYDFINKAESSSIHNILYNYRAALTTDYERDDSPVCFECNFLRGSMDPRKQAQYEKVTVRGGFRRIVAGSDDDCQIPEGLGGGGQMYFLCTVRLQNSQLVREMSIVDENKEFSSRHSLEWKFLFLDHRAPPIIGYLPFEVLGTSGYDYYHPDDLDGVTISHEQLMKTGEGTSCYYRFLTKGQQWIWLRSRYFIVYHQWNSKPEFINCTNTVVSYADVRSQRQQEMGLGEEVQSRTNIEPKPQLISRCSSVGSNSNNLPDSNVGVSSGYDDTGRDKLGAMQSPTSGTPVRSNTVSQQLQKFLQRHLKKQQQQQQQQQEAVATPPPSSTNTTFSSQQLHRLLYNKQNQGRPEEHHQTWILPRPPQMPEHLPRQQMPQASMMGLLNSPASGPSLMSPLDMLPTNMYMTPVQKQLHEQLQRKANQVQSMIFKQQEELKQIHQQLLFTQAPYPGNSADQLCMMGLDNVQGMGVAGGPGCQMVTSSASQGPQGGDQQGSMVNIPHIIVNQSVNPSVNQSAPVRPYTMMRDPGDMYLSLPSQENTGDQLNTSQQQ